MRTLVDIPEGKIEALAKICAEADISRAEAIRRAIDAFILSNASKPVEAFGLWKKRAVDGVEYQERMRDEW